MWNPYSSLDKQTKRLLGAVSVLTVLAVWAVVAASGAVGPAVLPTPWAVLQAFFRLLWNPSRGESLLITSTLWSVARVFIAAVFMVTLSVPFGVLLGASPKLNALFSPLIDPFRSAPVVALLPIFVMWLGIDEAMKIAFLFFGAGVYLVPMVRDAIIAVPSTYYIGARDIGATEWEAIKLAVIPIALPRIADAVIAAVSIEWTYITVAEYVNAGQGLGQMIQNARRFSAMDQVFVGIGVIIFLALLTYNVMSFLKRSFFPWETSS